MLFDKENNDHGASMVTQSVSGIDDPKLDEMLMPGHLETLRNDIELLDMAGDELDMDKVLKGELTPVFFGSAITNFGVEPFLQHFRGDPAGEQSFSFRRKNPVNFQVERRSRSHQRPVRIPPGQQAQGNPLFLCPQGCQV